MGDLQLNYIQEEEYSRELRKGGRKLDLNSGSKLTCHGGSSANLRFDCVELKVLVQGKCQYWHAKYFEFLSCV